VFEAETSNGRTVATDGDSKAALSPMELLGVATAGCMAIDIVHILTKARQAPAALEVAFSGERAEEDPRRFTAITLRVRVEGSVAQAQLDRAIQLSQDKYCSVWNSLRDDTGLDVVTEIHATATP
jgi:putative redox protein